MEEPTRKNRPLNEAETLWLYAVTVVMQLSRISSQYKQINENFDP